MEKIVLGLSGGVDSAAAALLLKEQGFEVHGLYLELGLGGEEEARRTADSLGAPLFIARRREPFERTVCEYFKAEYRAGRTPIPCVVCNPAIKFRALEDYADEIGARWIATGHYARIGKDGEGRTLLLRGASAKDQSYMLHRLPREVLARCVFPLGGMRSKRDVRELAARAGIPAAEKKDSMDLCFIPDGDWCGWLEARGVRLPEGNFVDPSGRVLGRHRGVHRYTVGQRRGLGVSASGRLFVSELRPETGEVVLSLEDPVRRALEVESVCWCAPEYAADGPFSCEVRVRFSSRADRAVVFPSGSRARVEFETGVRAPAPGQAAVFYDGDVVIGGGFIGGSPCWPDAAAGL